MLASADCAQTPSNGAGHMVKKEKNLFWDTARLLGHLVHLAQDIGNQTLSHNGEQRRGKTANEIRRREIKFDWNEIKIKKLDKEMSARIRMISENIGFSACSVAIFDLQEICGCSVSFESKREIGEKSETSIARPRCRRARVVAAEKNFSVRGLAKIDRAREKRERKSWKKMDEDEPQGEARPSFDNWFSFKPISFSWVAKYQSDEETVTSAVKHDRTHEPPTQHPTNKPFIFVFTPFFSETAETKRSAVNQLYFLSFDTQTFRLSVFSSLRDKLDVSNLSFLFFQVSHLPLEKFHITNPRATLANLCFFTSLCVRNKIQ